MCRDCTCVKREGKWKWKWVTLNWDKKVIERGGGDRDAEPGDKKEGDDDDDDMARKLAIEVWFSLN